MTCYTSVDKPDHKMKMIALNYFKAFVALFKFFHLKYVLYLLELPIEFLDTYQVSCQTICFSFRIVISIKDWDDATSKVCFANDVVILINSLKKHPCNIFLELLHLFVVHICIRCFCPPPNNLKFIWKVSHLN